MSHKTLRFLLVLAVVLVTGSLALPRAAGAMSAVWRQVSLTATKTGSLLVDNDGDTLADPGDTIQYEIVIENTDTVDASNVNLSDTVDANTTYVPASLAASPVAVDDDYSSTPVLANTLLDSTTTAQPSLYSNDYMGLNPTLTALTSADATSANGGTVSVNLATGEFVYTPPAGFTGADTFTYTLDNGVGAAPSVGTVTLDVTGPTIWFVNNDPAHYTTYPGNTGQIYAPFQSIADFNASPSVNPGDIVFIYGTGIDYTDGLVLQNDIQAFGEGVNITAELAAQSITFPTTTPPLPNAAGARPVIVPGAGNGVTLAQNNLLRGFNIGNTPGAGLAGNGFGTLEVDTMDITGSGQILNLTNGTLNPTATFGTLATTSASGAGILLDSVGGSLAATTTTISVSGVNGLTVQNSAGAGTFDFGTLDITAVGAPAVFASSNGTVTLQAATCGTISATNAAALDIDTTTLNVTCANITATTPASDGINLTSVGGTLLISTRTNIVNPTGGNDGVEVTSSTGTFTFGDLDISNSTGRGLVLNAAGTVNSTTGTISTPGQRAIDIQNTTLGMTLESVSASNTASAIVFNSTSGSFTVTGAVVDGSGGTIQDTTGSTMVNGASFTNATNITLQNMNFTNANEVDGGAVGTCDSLTNVGCNAAIQLSNVTGFTLDNVNINGVEENGINGIIVSGLSLQNDTLITSCGNAVNEACVRITELTGTSSIANSTVSFGAERNVLVENTTGSLTLNVSGSTFSDTQSSGTGADGLEVGALATAQVTVTVTNSSFLRNRTAGLQVLAEDNARAVVNASGSVFDPQGNIGRGIDLDANDSGRLIFQVDNNPTIIGYGGTAVNIFGAINADVDGQITNNSNIQGTLSQSGSGIVLNNNDNADMQVEVSNNTISNIGWDYGIQAISRGGSGRLDATIVNNSVTVSALSLYDIELRSQDSNTACGDIRNNSASAAAGTAFRARESAGTLLLEGFTTDATTTWNSNGNTPAGSVNESPAASASGGTCDMPVLVLAVPDGGDSPAMVAQPDDAPGDVALSAPVAVAGASGGGLPDALAAYVPTDKTAFFAKTQPVVSDSRTVIDTSPAAALRRSGETVTLPADIPTLPAGKSVTIVFNVTVDDPLTVSATEVCNQGTVTIGGGAAALTDDPGTAAADDPTCLLLDAVDLTVSKTESVDPVVAGSGVGNLTYVVTVTNNGPSGATGVTLSEVMTLPAGVTVDSITPSGTTTWTDPTWTVGALPNGASETLTVVLTVDASAAPGTDVISNTATITAADQSLANTTDDTATEATSIAGEVDLVISKAQTDPPGSVIPGSGPGNLTFVVTVTNNGPSNASGVTLSDVVTLASDVTLDSVTPSGATTWADPAWTVGNLAVGASETLTLVLTVGPSTPAVATVGDEATVTGANETRINTGDDTASLFATIAPAVDLTVSKTESIDPVVRGSGPGNLTYVVTVTNNGPSDATGLGLTETLTLPAGVTVDSITPSGTTTWTDPTWTVGDLAVGASETLTVVLTVDGTTAPGTDVISDTAAVTTVDADIQNPGDDSVTEATSVITGTDLEVTKTESIDPVLAGSGPGNLTYVVTVTNNGPLDATGVALSEVLTLPAGVTVDSITPSGTTTWADPTWTVGSLPNGASETLTVVLTADGTTVPGTDVISDTATITAVDQVDANASNNSVTESTSVAGQVDLAVSKTESADPVVAGSGAGNLTYVVTVTNNGPSEATGLTLGEVLTLPAGVTIDSVTPSGATTWADPTWTVGTLPNGTSETLTVVLTVDATTAAGTDVIGDTASVAGVNEILINTGDDSATETTSVTRDVDLTVSKTESADPVAAGSGPGNLTYVVTVTNNGPSDATGVTLSEVLTLPAGVTVDSITPSGATTWADPTWTVGSLPNGTSETLTVVLTVGASAATGTDVISDTATVTAANEPLSSTNDDSATESTSINRQVDLVVSKTESVDPVLAGSGPGNLTYVVTVTNNGPSDATGVTLSEALTLPAGVTVDSITPSGATTWADPTWTVGSLPNGASETLTVVLTADATAPTGVDSISDTATITAVNEALINTGDDSATESTSVASVPSLATSAKSVSDAVSGNNDGQAQPGEVLTYEITATNSGDQPATNVVVTDAAPANTSFDTGSVSIVSNTGGGTPTITLGNTAGDTSLQVDIDTISGGGSVVIAFTVTVAPSPLPAGVTEIGNTAEIAADGIPQFDTPPAVIPVDATIDIAATKTDALLIDVNGDTLASPGDTIEYTVLITNTGDQDADNVVFTDVPDASSTLVAGSVTTTQGTVTTGNTPGDTSVQVDIGLLPGDGTTTVTTTFQVTVDDPLPPAVTRLENQGTVTGDGVVPVQTDDPDLPGTADPTLTPLGTANEPVLEVTKNDTLLVDADADTLPSAGDTLQYSVLIYNTGTVDALNVLFSDTPDPNAPLLATTVTTTQGTVTSGNTAGDTTVTVDIGTIPSGAGVAITFDVMVVDPFPDGVTQVENQGTVSADDITPVLSDDPATAAISDPTITVIGANALLTAYKTDALTQDGNSNGEADAGDHVTYTVTIANTGNVDITNLVFTDTPSSHTQLVAGSVTVSDPGATIVTGNTAGDTSVDVTIPLLAPAASVVIEFEVRINDPLPETLQSFENQGAVAADGDLAIVTDDPDTVEAGDPTRTPLGEREQQPAPGPGVTVFDPALSKIGVLMPGQLGLPGEQLTWIITVVNNGTLTATDIVITDTLVPQLRIESAETDRGTLTIDQQTVAFFIPLLAPGESVQMRIYTTVVSSPDDGILRNTAFLTGGGEMRTASAEVEVPTALPGTGYPPGDGHTSPRRGWWIGGAFGLLAGLCLVSVGLWLRRRWLTH